MCWYTYVVCVQVAGRLHIELCRVAGTLPERIPDDLSSESSGDNSRPNSFIEMDDETGVAIGSTIVCRVSNSSPNRPQ